MTSSPIQPLNASERTRRITRTSFIGIAANILLAAFKAAVGAVTGSVAIILDALNNLTDALSSVLTIIGVKLANRPPDTEHPFGHGRVEYFSAVTIAALVFAAGTGALAESVRKIIHPATPEYGFASLVIVSVAVIAKLALGHYVTTQGRACRSDALVASGADASLDALVSASTLAGAAILLSTGVNLDGWIGAVISLVIVKSGAEMFFGAIDHIMGARPDPAMAKAIRGTIASVKGVLGVHDLVLHNYGPASAIGSVHVEVASHLTAADVYRVTHAVQTKVTERHHIMLTVGIYAVDPRRQAERERIETTVLRHPGVMGVHGLFFDDDAKTISFDVLVDFSVKDRHALKEALLAEIAPSFPDRTISIVFDSHYTD